LAAAHDQPGFVRRAAGDADLATGKVRQRTDWRGAAHHDTADSAGERGEAQFGAGSALDGHEHPVRHDNVGSTCHQCHPSGFGIGEGHGRQGNIVFLVQRMPCDDVSNPLHGAELEDAETDIGGGSGGPAGGQKRGAGREANSTCDSWVFQVGRHDAMVASLGLDG
jgi:hypothetical protein